MDVTSGSALELIAENTVVMGQVALGIEKLNEAQVTNNQLMGINIAVIVVILAFIIFWLVYRIIHNFTSKSIF